MKRIACILLLTLAAPAVAQEGLPTANDAIRLALADVRTLPPEERYYQQYVWVWDGDYESAQAVSDTAQNIGCAPVIWKLPFIGKGKLLLCRVDMNILWPNDEDLARAIDTWQEFRFSRMFNILFTRDMLRFAFAHGLDERIEFPRRYRQDGRMHSAVATKNNYEQYNVLRVEPEHIDLKLLHELQNETCSAAPIVPHDEFVARSNSSIRDADKDDGIFDTLYGGLYERFLGTPNKSKKGTDLGNLLANLGVGRAGQSFDDVLRELDKLGGDKRVAMTESEVTGMPRAICFVPIRKADAFESVRIAIITMDLQRSNIDIGNDPLRNLLYIRPDAYEVRLTRLNGTIESHLFNGKQQLLEQAADNVVHDGTIPQPYWSSLEGRIGCVRCHEAKPGLNGFQHVTNNVKDALEPGVVPRLDIIADLSAIRHLSRREVQSRIAGLYSGEPEDLLKRARMDYSRAVYRSTKGEWKQGTDLMKIVQTTAERTTKIWGDYRLGKVTTRQALKELGWDIADVKDKDGKPDAEATNNLAAKVFSGLVPPTSGFVTQANTVYGYFHNSGYFVPEDPLIQLLKKNKTIKRHQFDQLYGLLAARMQATIKANPKLLQQPEKKP